MRQDQSYEAFFITTLSNYPDTYPTRASLNEHEIQTIDAEHIWHPYSSFNSQVPVFSVKSTQGVHITLHNGKILLDGMSSWWSAIHGYNHPYISECLANQTKTLSHIMFGGLTHEPAAYLCKQLVELTPSGLEKVFLSDSGSISVEVAMKMAMQYWAARNQPQKTKMLALKKGYHGDSLGAMSVCDPVTGMHHLFKNALPEQIFTNQPSCTFNEAFLESSLDDLKQKLHLYKDEIAAFIVEPIVQGAGGMHFYSPTFLQRAHELCCAHNVLFIADEIATGFGRTGKLFACEHANISPDIMCLGKTLTGGTMTLAATLSTAHVANTICSASPGVFMHGPTYMANPLACTAASASIDLLVSSDWQKNIARIEERLKDGLAKCQSLSTVKNVRVLGAIGVVEMHEPVDMATIQPMFIEHNIWIRPFGKLVYMMPAYIMLDNEVDQLTSEVFEVIKEYSNKSIS